MGIELLRSNIQKVREITNELSMFSGKLNQLSQFGQASSNDVILLQNSISNLGKQLKVINNAIPGIVNSIQFYRKFGIKENPLIGKKIKGLAKISYNHPEKPGQKVELGVKKTDHVKYLDSALKIKASAKKLEKNELKTDKLESKRKKVTFFIKLSNKYFRSFSEKLVEQGSFKDLNKDLRKITSPYLLRSYISMMFMGTTIAFILGFLLSILSFVFKQWLLGAALLFASPAIAFLLFYSYPSSERKSLEKGINQELPFVAIYMSAVATSGIEPSKIFSIIVRTKDYPYTQREIKKLLNYVNFYGYDLVSALRLGSKTSPSDRLAMLFNGVGTTIRSGGELTDFLQKHAETLLFDYRLEREKYTKLAETFMDIYISIVIAAPMIMMILFVLITLTGYGSAFLTPGIISFLIVSVVSALNVGFLVFLNLKQPKF
jgi:Flp pilus assembly protein TadB